MDKGKLLREEADNIMKKRILLYGASEKHEAAGEKYIAAANAYRMMGELLFAGECFLCAARCAYVEKNMFDYLARLKHASLCFSTASPTRAIKIICRIIEEYNNDGNFRQSCKYYMDLAKLYEDTGALSNAISTYEACERIESHSSNCSALLKITNVLCHQPGVKDYAKIAATFESIVLKYSDGPLSRFRIKSCIVPCCLSYIALGDSVKAQLRLDEFNEGESCREYQFIKDIITAVDTFNEDAFSDVCYQYDRVSPLTQWTTETLLLIKSQICNFGDNDLNLC